MAFRISALSLEMPENAILRALEDDYLSCDPGPSPESCAHPARFFKGSDLGQALTVRKPSHQRTDSGVTSRIYR